MAGNPRYIQLLEEMKSLHERKNAGYAGMDTKDHWANFRMSEAFGVSSFLGCLVRMSDKYIRITNLVKNPKNEQVGENIKDTLFDLAAYALIAICLLEEKDKVEEVEIKDMKNHIIVNGREIEYDSNIIYYSDALALAGYDPSKNLSVLVSYNGVSKSLIPYTNTEIGSGAIINIADTSNA